MEAFDYDESEVRAMQVFQRGSVPRLKARDIYSTSVFNLFSNKKVKMIQFSVPIPLKGSGVQLSQFPLFTEREVTKMRTDRNCKYIHFGCFRIFVVPHVAGGIKAPLRLGLFDTKHSNLPDALAGCYRGNLGLGYQYKDIYPNVSMPVADAKFWNVLVSLAGLDMKMGSIPCSVMVEGVYCLTNTESQPSPKGSNVRRLSIINIPVTETPEGEDPKVADETQ